MNKKRVDKWIPYARDAIEKVGIAADGAVEKTFRAQISSFGAAVVMGSLKASVAFFAENGAASVERSKLLQAIDYVIARDSGIENPEIKSEKAVFEDVCRNDSLQRKEQFIDAAIAIKLAMNFFELKKTDERR